LQLDTIRVLMHATSGNTVALWFVCHACCSISLTLLNKMLATVGIGAVCVVTTQQCLAVLIAIAFHLLKWQPLCHFSLSHMMIVMPLAVVFVFLLWSSLAALSRASVPLVVVGRSLTPLCTAALEHQFKGSIPCRSFLPLLSIVAGSLIYATQDTLLDLAGVGYVLLNVALSAVAPLVERFSAQQLKLPAAALAFRRNLATLLLLSIWLVVEHSSGKACLASVNNLSWYTLVALCLSAIFGVGISWAAFSLQSSHITVTSIVTANNLYKLIVLAASIYLWGLPFRAVGWMGLALNFAGVFAYYYS